MTEPYNLRGAYFSWYYRYYRFQKTDDLIAGFLKAEITNTSWLKLARKALFLTLDNVAKKLNVSRQEIARIEEYEELGKVKLETLRRVAEAMDCEFVYAIRPKSRLRFSEVIWKSLEEEDITLKKLPRLQYQINNATAGTATKKMQDPEVRRKKKWTERKGFKN
jgi:transcriptional regulator with XRE-family HTH domain